MVEPLSEGSDGFQLLNVLLKPSRRLPNRLQSPLLALEVVAHLIAKLDFLADFAVQAVELGHFFRDSAVDFRSLRPLFIDLGGHGAQFDMALNPKLLETVQLALGGYRPVLRLVPRALKGLYLGLERSRGADLHLVRIKAPVALRAKLVAQGALVPVGLRNLLPEVLLKPAHGSLGHDLPLALGVLAPFVRREQLLGAQSVKARLPVVYHGRDPDVRVGRALVQMDLGGEQVLVAVPRPEPVDATVQKLPCGFLVQGIVARNDKAHRADCVVADFPLGVQLAHTALDRLVERQRVRVIGTAAVPDVPTALVNIVCVGVRPPIKLLAHGFKALAFGRLHGNQGCYGHVKLPSSNRLKVR